MPRPVHFDITASDPPRLAKFYTDIFLWKFEKWEGPMEYWTIRTGESQPGIDGGLSKRNGQDTSTTNTIDVPNVDAYLAKITAAGGKVLRPKMAIPGVGWFASCADPEGNEFGLMQADPSRK